MADSSGSFQLVSIAEVARVLNVSDSTVRRLVKSGRLEAEQVQRPQGHVWLVKVPAAVTGPSDHPSRQIGAAGAEPSAPPALAAWMTSVLDPLVTELGTSRQRIEDLARENGRQAAELERAASIAVTLSDELETVKAENRALVDSREAQPTEPTWGAIPRPVANVGAVAAARLDPAAGVRDRAAGGGAVSGETVAAVALAGWPKVNPAGLPWHQLLDVPVGGPVLLALVAWLWLLWRLR